MIFIYLNTNFKNLLFEKIKKRLFTLILEYLLLKDIEKIMKHPKIFQTILLGNIISIYNSFMGKYNM